MAKDSKKPSRGEAHLVEDSDGFARAAKKADRAVSAVKEAVRKVSRFTSGETGSAWDFSPPSGEKAYKGVGGVYGGGYTALLDKSRAKEKVRSKGESLDAHSDRKRKEFLEKERAREAYQRKQRAKKK